jgi:hypothetical protein
VPLEELPYLDEQAVVVAAPTEAIWTAVPRTLADGFGARPARQAARLLGCDPTSTSGWDRPGVGSTVPGFRIVTAQPPQLLVVAGRHRFSRYGIVVRIEPGAGGTRLRAESRATFPGPHGALYRLGVVGSGGHVLAVRRLLRQVRRAAESTAPAGTP